MDAVILAAGMGRRLAAMGWDQPKCLLLCPQGTLLDNAIGSAHAHGAHRFLIVVGYRKELVTQAATAHSGEFVFVENPDFATTNTLRSLRLALERVAGGFLLFNGDVWLRPEVLDRLDDESGSALAVEPKSCGDEEVKVSVDPTDRIEHIGKSLPPDRSLGEYVGVARFDNAFAAALRVQAERIDSGAGSENLYYESAIDVLLGVHPLKATRIPTHHAIEIDTPDDLESARRIWTA